MSLIAHPGAAEIIKSQWRTRDARIDGATVEWPALTQLEKGVWVGAAHDANVLHVALVVSDVSIQQRLLIAGLVLYFDPSRRRQQTTAVRLPPLRGRVLNDRDPSAVGVTYVEAIGPGKDDARIIDVPAESGLDAVAAGREGSVTIEVLVPLRHEKHGEFAVGLPQGRGAITLGFATWEPRAVRRRRDDPVRMGGPLGRGAAPGGAAPDVEERVPTGKAFETWVTVDLAARP